MVSERKFYMTIRQIIAVSDVQMDDMSASQLCREGYDGDVSLSEETVLSDVIDGKAAAELLIRQGSDPSFLMLTYDGNDEVD